MSETLGPGQHYVWVDFSDAPLEEILREAIITYMTVYDSKPTMCLVHASIERQTVHGVRLIPKAMVLPGYWWLGVEEE